jgi:DNA polymerase-1
VARGPVVHLIDGHILVFRAYYSLPPMQAPDGTPTNAAYGFANSLIKYLADKRPTHVAVAFDYAMESFRNEIEPEYKANRGDTPEDLEPQFDLCARITEALGVPAFEQQDFEADDVIATLAAQLRRKRARVVVVTTDKDLAQLVRPDGTVWLHDPGRDEPRDAAAVRAKFGVEPEQIPDYLGLVGDSVDHLPGVPGVGPRTAAAALGAFGAIERIPADPAESRGGRHRWPSRTRATHARAGDRAPRRARRPRRPAPARLPRSGPRPRGRPVQRARLGPDHHAHPEMGECLKAAMRWDPSTMSARSEREARRT